MRRWRPAVRPAGSSSCKVRRTTAWAKARRSLAASRTSPACTASSSRRRTSMVGRSRAAARTSSPNSSPMNEAAASGLADLGIEPVQPPAHDVVEPLRQPVADGPERAAGIGDIEAAQDLLHEQRVAGRLVGQPAGDLVPLPRRRGGPAPAPPAARWPSGGRPLSSRRSTSSPASNRPRVCSGPIPSTSPSRRRHDHEHGRRRGECRACGGAAAATSARPTAGRRAPAGRGAGWRRPPASASPRRRGAGARRRGRRPGRPARRRCGRPGRGGGGRGPRHGWPGRRAAATWGWPRRRCRAPPGWPGTGRAPPRPSGRTARGHRPAWSRSASSAATVVLPMPGSPETTTIRCSPRQRAVPRPLQQLDGTVPTHDQSRGGPPGPSEVGGADVVGGETVPPGRRQPQLVDPLVPVLADRQAAQVHQVGARAAARG